MKTGSVVLAPNSPRAITIRCAGVSEVMYVVMLTGMMNTGRGRPM